MPEPSSQGAAEDPQTSTAAAAGHLTPSAGGTQIPEFQFEGLSQGAACVRIKLGSEVYTLRRTRTEKLVLNK